MLSIFGVGLITPFYLFDEVALDAPPPSTKAEQDAESIPGHQQLKKSPRVKKTSRREVFEYSIYADDEFSAPREHLISSIDDIPEGELKDKILKLSAKHKNLVIIQIQAEDYTIDQLLYGEFDLKPNAILSEVYVER